MAASERTLRHYRMLCRRCGGTWDTAYDVVTFHVAEGDHEFFYLRGLPAMAPWSGVSCPNLRWPTGHRPAISRSGG
jgi:hypothetical protein